MTKDCEKCEGAGTLDCFEDCWSYGSNEGHYTRDWTEECSDCNGSGRVEVDDEEDVSIGNDSLKPE